MKLNKEQKHFGPLPGTSKGKGSIGVYPEVIDEYLTMDLMVGGHSIARYGDGELNLALGGSCVSQREIAPGIREELCRILAEPGKCFVGIPNIYSRTPKHEAWLKFATQNVTKLYRQPKYVSSFVTRPDSAPWIDTPVYWNKLRSLWQDRDVTLVLGSMRSLRPDWMMTVGSRITEVWAPRTNAYKKIDELVEQVGRPNHPILICLGPTATCLAHRLANKGLWALDMGHVGMFMRHQGSFQYKLPDLVTDEYRSTLEKTHEKLKDVKKGGWGVSGKAFAETVVEYYRELEGTTILDYGCGQETLRVELAKLNPPIRVSGYDPGIPKKSGMPKPCDLVVCTEVMEHVEEPKIDNVLDHIFNLAGKGAFFSIACSDSREVLTDGRDAHITIHPPKWWVERLGKWGGWKLKVEDRKVRVLIWATKI